MLARLVSLAPFALVCLAACQSEPPSPSGTDAGARPDAAAQQDANTSTSHDGGRVDSGNDGGGVVDASDVLDGRVDATPDAAPGPDAGVITTPYVYIGTGDWGGAEPGRIATYVLEDDGTLTFVERIEAGSIAAFMAADLSNPRLYVADEGGNALRRFDVDSATGRLTFVDSTSTSGAPVHVALDPTGTALLTAHYNDGVTRVFALDDTGIGDAPVDTESSGPQSHAVTLSPDGRFAYVCSTTGQAIAQYAFDSTTRQLTALDPPTIAQAGAPRHAAISADGRFLYAVSESGDGVVAYSRATDGTLSWLAEYDRLPVGASGSGAEILLSPRGHLYVSNRDPSNTLAVFDVDASTGLLTLVEHEPTGGMTPRNFGIDPEGRFLIVGNRQSQNVVVFAIDPVNGALEQKHVVATEGRPFFVGIYAFAGAPTR